MGNIRQDDRFLWLRLLSNVTTSTDGVWVELRGRHPVTVTIEGAFTAAASVLVSCNPERPLDSFNDAPVFDGVAHTAPARVTIDSAVQWLKVRVVGLSAGSISAFVMSGPGPNSC